MFAFCIAVGDIDFLFIFKRVSIRAMLVSRFPLANDVLSASIIEPLEVEVLSTNGFKSFQLFSNAVCGIEYLN